MPTIGVEKMVVDKKWGRKNFGKFLSGENIFPRHVHNAWRLMAEDFSKGF